MKTATGSHSGRSVQKIESLGARREKGYGGAGGRRKELGKGEIGEGAMGGDLGSILKSELVGLNFNGLKRPIRPIYAFRS